MKRSKYGAIPTVIEGQQFASRKEAGRYLELWLAQQAGEITELVCQPRFALYVPWREAKWDVDQDAPGATLTLGGDCRARRVGRYTADFAYTRKDGQPVVEDVKGGRATRTEAYRLRKRMVEAMYGVRVEEV